MDNLRCTINEHTSDGELDFGEISNINNEISFLNSTYNMVIDNIEEALLDFSSQRVKEGYKDLGEDVHEFWNKVKERIKNQCNGTTYSINASANMVDGGEADYAKAGLKIKNSSGTSLELGLAGAYGSQTAEGELKYIELGDGSFHVGKEINSSTVYGAGIYMEIMQELAKNTLEVGLEYLYIPVCKENIRDIIEGRNNIPGGAEVEPRTTTETNDSKGEIHYIGPKLEAGIPLGPFRGGVELGFLYDVNEKKGYFVTGVNVQLEFNGGK
ncbi:hypothetical protein ACFLTH_17885, partial [Bacteroidota bacterium]